MKNSGVMKGMCIGLAAGAAIGMLISPIRRKPKNLVCRLTKALSELADSAAALIWP